MSEEEKEESHIENIDEQSEIKKKKKKKKKKKQVETDCKEEEKPKEEITELKNDTIIQPIIRAPKITIDDCYILGESIDCILISTKFVNMRSPLVWLCKCGNKFSESYYNIFSNHRACLKCSYKKFSARNKK